MIRRILGGVAVALSTAIPATAQVTGTSPVAKVERGTTRAAALGKPIFMPSSQPTVAEIMPTAAELGVTPAGFSASAMPGTEYCDPCGVCGPAGRVWASAEWLYWVTSGQSLPPLATGAPMGTPLATAGVAGEPTTTTLFGNQRVNNDWRNGLRARAGLWLDDQQTRGLELEFLMLEHSGAPFAASSDGSSILTRPFFNVTTGLRDTQLVSFPGIVAGTGTVRAGNNVIGGGISYLHNLCCDPCGRTDLILGYRYLNVSDTVEITENLIALPGSNVPAGTNFVIQDSFKTSNNFHGAVIGLAHERRFGRAFIGVRASVGLGDNYQTTTISGNTTITAPGGAPTTYPGGLLTQPSNIGKYTSNNFAVMPEIGVKLGFQVTEQVRVFAGYNFLYLSNVARAGDQIDVRVNTTQLAPSAGLVGPALPAYDRKSTDFWMQGVSLGAELRF